MKKAVISVAIASALLAGSYILLNDNTKLIDAGNDKCFVFDTSDWTQEQKNLTLAASYSLVYKEGKNITPTHWDAEKGELCFPKSIGNSVLKKKDIETEIVDIIQKATTDPVLQETLDQCIRQCELDFENAL